MVFNMDFLLQTVAPTVGTIVSIVMYGTPVSAALNVKKTGQLGVCGQSLLATEEPLAMQLQQSLLAI